VNIRQRCRQRSHHTAAATRATLGGPTRHTQAGSHHNSGREKAYQARLHSAGREERSTQTQLNPAEPPRRPERTGEQGRSAAVDANRTALQRRQQGRNTPVGGCAPTPAVAAQPAPLAGVGDVATASTPRRAGAVSGGRHHGRSGQRGAKLDSQNDKKKFKRYKNTHTKQHGQKTRPKITNQRKDNRTETSTEAQTDRGHVKTAKSHCYGQAATPDRKTCSNTFGVTNCSGYNFNERAAQNQYFILSATWNKSVVHTYTSTHIHTGKDDS